MPSSCNNERVAAMYLSNPNDTTRLSWKEVQEQWGSWTAFLQCYNLRPFDYNDLEEALQISRLLKETGRKTPSKRMPSCDDTQMHSST
jgi:hypothetical protein